MKFLSLVITLKLYTFFFICITANLWYFFFLSLTIVTCMMHSSPVMIYEYSVIQWKTQCAGGQNIALLGCLSPPLSIINRYSWIVREAWWNIERKYCNGLVSYSGGNCNTPDLLHAMETEISSSWMGHLPLSTDFTFCQLSFKKIACWGEREFLGWENWLKLTTKKYSTEKLYDSKNEN